METLFWGHASRKDPDVISIYFRLTIDGFRAEIGSTGIKINRSQWSQDAQRITTRSAKAQQQNIALGEWESRAWAIYNDLQRTKEPFTANYVKLLFHKDGKGYNFLRLFDLYLDQLKKDPEITAATVETYKVVRDRVSDWLTLTNKADLLAVHFGRAVIEQYRTFMKNELKRKPSTVRKHTNTIKQVTAFGNVNDHINRDPLQGYKVPGVKYADPIFLTKAELVSLLAFEFGEADHVLSEVRDAFVIQCFTGLAYADLKTLRSEHFTFRESDAACIWLEKDRKKTDITARQPLHPIVQGILTSRYGGKPENLRVRPNQKMNLYLKVIALRLNFAKKLSTHTGRKTFSNLCLNGGLYAKEFAPSTPFADTVLSTESTIAMMGRTSAKGLEVYARPDERRILAELKKSA